MCEISIFSELSRSAIVLATFITLRYPRAERFNFAAAESRKSFAEEVILNDFLAVRALA